MDSIYLNKDGRITIPKRLRKKFGIDKGTKIFFSEVSDGIKLIPITPKTIEENKGFLKTEGRLLKALMKEKSF